MAERAAVSKAKNRFLKLLPKASAVAVTFQNLPFSPNKDKRSSDKSKSKGFSGASGGATLISIVPVDALHSKSRNSSLREPTSPKVSCMGQVKHKKKLYSLINTNYTYQDSVLPPLDHLNRMVQNHNNSKQAQQKPPALKSAKSFGDVKKKKKPLAIKNMFSRVPSGRRKSDATIHVPDDHRASTGSLSQMKRFSSGRNSLSNFDWTTVAQVVDNFGNGSGESKEEVEVSISNWTTVAQVVDNFGNGSGESKEEVEVSISAATPMIIQECKAVSLEPRKEVNLWKRRTMAQPSPLQLKT
ncbi:hypothetical protein POM88_016768 [Heracleum sosnowskyi]|uniref:Uncharacterized protein n=1 Tax=Heracleum sosnowskyi TaxID=360622 RepID=A0AAD8MTA6_9APIA|nr:hypothetical protein POM88_016768 [Heracleum sosnowskyi]